MAHASDRTLVQALGIGADHKTQDHDLVCLYLQTGARRLAERYLLDGSDLSRWSSHRGRASEEGSRRVYASREDLLAKDIQSKVESNKLCGNCGISLYARYSNDDWKSNREGVTKTVSADRIDVVTTRMERPVTRGSGQYTSLVGFIDLSIRASRNQEIRYDETILHYYRRCRQVVVDSPTVWDGCTMISPSVSHEDTSHTAEIAIPFAVQSFTIPIEYDRIINIEVKTRPVPLGDLIRQINLYKEFSGGDIWIVATTVALSTAYCSALHNEGIRTLFVGEEYKQADAPAQMEMF